MKEPKGPSSLHELPVPVKTVSDAMLPICFVRSRTLRLRKGFSGVRVRHRRRDPLHGERDQGTTRWAGRDPKFNAEMRPERSRNLVGLFEDPTTRDRGVLPLRHTGVRSNVPSDGEDPGFEQLDANHWRGRSAPGNRRDCEHESDQSCAHVSPPNGSRFSCGRPAQLRVSIRRPTRVNRRTGGRRPCDAANQPKRGGRQLQPLVGQQGTRLGAIDGDQWPSGASGNNAYGYGAATRISTGTMTQWQLSLLATGLASRRVADRPRGLGRLARRY